MLSCCPVFIFFYETPCRAVLQTKSENKKTCPAVLLDFCKNQKNLSYCIGTFFVLSNVNNCPTILSCSYFRNIISKVLSCLYSTKFWRQRKLSCCLLDNSQSMKKAVLLYCKRIVKTKNSVLLSWYFSFVSKKQKHLSYCPVLLVSS